MAKAKWGGRSIGSTKRDVHRTGKRIAAKKGKRIAVRVVSQFGEESTKVISLG